MNKFTLLGILIATLAVAIIFNASKDVTTYSNFQEAISSQSRVKVVGTLHKEIPTEYDALNAPNLFKFYLKDDKGKINKVLLKKAKPQDFERAENIVITGQMQGEDFVADEILMKCPSKYKQEEIKIKSSSL